MFEIQYVLFEYFVILCGLCNALETFQSYINEILQNILHNFCTIYLDNIFLYSESIFIYTKYIFKMLFKLYNIILFFDIQKYDFLVKEVKYPKIIISITDFKINPSKVNAILNRKIICYVKNVQSFLRFANFY